MKIRTKLVFLTSGLVMLIMSLLSYGIIAVQRSFKEQDMRRSAQVIEDSVQRVAMDALLQKDELQLISYVNFLKVLYPALTYAKITWHTKRSAQDFNLGPIARGSGILEVPLEVADPSDSRLYATISLGIDQSVIEADVKKAQWRLERVVIGIWGLASLLGIIAAFWLGHTFTAPLQSVAALASEIGAGNLGIKIEWKSEDEIGELVKVFNDMSERLSELDEAKRNFVSAVTHELRSPLGAVESFLHLIEDKLARGGSASVAESLEYLHRSRENVERLGRFINDLLDAAKIEKGKMTCIIEPMSLEKTTTEVIELFTLKAAEKNVVLESHLDHPPMVMGDEDRIKQVLTNLITNSLKFTLPGGRITLSCEQYRDAAGRKIEVSVADTGVGIDQDDLSRLFAPFSQGRNAKQQHGGGTGLGLYIVKAIIDQHGGLLDVASAPGKGTKVTFSLKVAEEPAADKEA